MSVSYLHIWSSDFLLFLTLSPFSPHPHTILSHLEESLATPCPTDCWTISRSHLSFPVLAAWHAQALNFGLSLIPPHSDDNCGAETLSHSFHSDLVTLKYSFQKVKSWLSHKYEMNNDRKLKSQISWYDVKAGSEESVKSRHVCRQSGRWKWVF